MYKYPGDQIGPVNAEVYNSSANRTTTLAPEIALRRLPDKAIRLSAYDGGGFPDVKYRYLNIKGGNIDVHFQGIQRRSATRSFLFLSGGDPDEGTKGSQLFVVRMESRDSKQLGPWGTNIDDSGSPAKGDQVVGMYMLDEELWHAGGISLMGDVLAIPLENEQRSEIRFYDVTNPEALKQLPNSIKRANARAAAVGMCRLPDNGHILCGVWAEKPLRVDFYISTSTGFQQGFGKPTTSPLPHRALSPSYQSIGFIRDRNNGIFMLGTRSTHRIAPLKGSPVADLFRVDLDEQLALELCASREFRKDDHFDFAAGAGAYVDGGGRLVLYSVYHWRYEGRIRIGEFCPSDEG